MQQTESFQYNFTLRSYGLFRQKYSVDIESLLRLVIEIVPVIEERLAIGYLLCRCHKTSESFKPFLSSNAPIDDLYLLFLILRVLDSVSGEPWDVNIYNDMFDDMIQHVRCNNRSSEYLPQSLMRTTVHALKVNLRKHNRVRAARDYYRGWEEDVGPRDQPITDSHTRSEEMVTGKFRSVDFTITSFKGLGNVDIQRTLDVTKHSLLEKGQHV
ncbi:hypothetical protein BDZ45DRAFT_449015 [Acephala macrosclerotiorum]|nr:hypothetical protein BDZ45DRAFT_449015 [Acephala macrosclerotiorum]